MFTCLAHQGWHSTATTSVCKERFGGMAAAEVGRLERSDTRQLLVPPYDWLRSEAGASE